MSDVAHLRVAFRYKQYDRAWWEVHATQDTNFDTVKNKLQAVITASLAVRHPSVFCAYVRVSNPFSPRQAITFRFPITIPVTPSFQPSVTSTSANYKLLGDNDGVKRTVWIRGLNAGDVTRNTITGQDVPGGNLPANVNAYYAALRAANYGIPSLYPASTANYQTWPIDSISVLTLKRVKVNFTGAPVFGDKKRVIIYRVPQKLFPGLRGTFTVANDATGFIPRNFSSELAVGDYELVGATFRTAEFRFSSYKTGNPEFLNFDRRDTKGGPLDGRGRARAVIRRGR
jgi:hypothetical protein